ncbi:MAG: transposase zinc-binding domain-containing protein [Deltaproteobacteria bacterium]|nr:MAG: transposase zinc-binding domain-containing protein [Deltaproteobacteria bacterium]
MESAATFLRTDEPKLYRPRRPERSPFYAVLHHYFDSFTREYEHRFERTFGPLRGIIPKTVERFLDCGLPEVGFARVRCDACENEYLVAFSFKQRGFCPSCSVKRARRKSWARLIRRVYEVDPLLCPCGQRMRVAGFIAQAPVIRKIESPHRAALRPPETPRTVAAAFRRLLPRPVSGLRTTVRRPGTEPLPSSPSASTFEVRGGFGLNTIPFRVYGRRKAAGCGGGRRDGVFPVGQTGPATGSRRQAGWMCPPG